MARETLRDRYRTIIGYIDTDRTGVRIARDHLLRTLGTYDPRTGVTRDHYGRLLGSGDLLTRLVP